jgi:hypothetical protein
MHDHSWKACICPTGQKVLRCYQTQNSITFPQSLPSLELNVIQLSPVGFFALDHSNEGLPFSLDTFDSIFPKIRIHLCLIAGSVGSLNFTLFPLQKSNIWWWKQIMGLIDMEFLLCSLYIQIFSLTLYTLASSIYPFLSRAYIGSVKKLQSLQLCKNLIICWLIRKLYTWLKKQHILDMCLPITTIEQSHLSTLREYCLNFVKLE